MKTTSFEISKKLAEIGFKADKIEFAYKISDPSRHLFEVGFMGDSRRDEYCQAFDLETILEALPKYLEQDNGFEAGLRFWWADGASWIGYQNFSGFIITVDVNQKESLADTAARLLILLHEKGLVKFPSQPTNLKD